MEAIVDTTKYKDLPLEKKIHKKEIILDELKKREYKITEKRKLIIDIILNNECSCSKEIYWEALQKDPSIGIATIYRMVKILEEIGAINRKNLYQISHDYIDCLQSECTIVLKNKKVIQLSAESWLKAVKAGLTDVGILDGKEIDSVLLKKYNCLLGGNQE